MGTAFLTEPIRHNQFMGGPDRSFPRTWEMNSWPTHLSVKLPYWSRNAIDFPALTCTGSPWTSLANSVSSPLMLRLVIRNFRSRFRLANGIMNAKSKIRARTESLNINCQNVFQQPQADPWFPGGYDSLSIYMTRQPSHWCRTER